jgi:predicted GIY-YIG superfamily endonuclease
MNFLKVKPKKNCDENNFNSYYESYNNFLIRVNKKFKNIVNDQDTKDFFINYFLQNSHLFSSNININYIDWNKSYIYILQLEHNKFYVGRSSCIFKRIFSHFHKKGSIFTKHFKPILVLDIIEESSKFDEKNITIDTMIKYGWQNTRGYSWCKLYLKKPPKIIQYTINKKKKQSLSLSI